jgi:hypothetical protein
MIGPNLMICAGVEASWRCRRVGPLGGGNAAVNRTNISREDLMMSEKRCTTKSHTDIAALSS